MGLFILGILIIIFIVFPIIGAILEIFGIGFSIIWYFIKKTLRFIVWILIILFIIFGIISI